MSVFNRDLIVQLLNKILGKADLAIGKTDEVLGDTKKILTAVSGGTGAVKSVQRGTARFTAKGFGTGTQLSRIEPARELLVTLSPINPQKCIVLIEGVAKYDDYSNTTRFTPVIIGEVTKNAVRFKLPRIDGSNGMGTSDYEVPKGSTFPSEGLECLSKTIFSWQVIEFY